MSADKYPITFLCQMEVMVYLYHALQMWQVYPCFFLGVFTVILVWGVFNETKIPLTLLGYESIIANLYPVCTCQI